LTNRGEGFTLPPRATDEPRATSHEPRATSHERRAGGRVHLPGPGASNGRKATTSGGRARPPLHFFYVLKARPANDEGGNPSPRAHSPKPAHGVGGGKPPPKSAPPCSLQGYSPPAGMGQPCGTPRGPPAPTGTCIPVQACGSRGMGAASWGLTDGPYMYPLDNTAVVVLDTT